MLINVQAALRRSLGEFVDEWMLAKIELMKKLKARIALEGDPKKLVKLRRELNDALISEDDISQMSAKFTKLLAMVAENVSKINKIMVETKR